MNKISKASFVSLGKLSTLVVAVVMFCFVGAMPVSSKPPVHTHERLVLILEEGDTVLFVPLGEDPSGSSASVSNVNIGPVGSYVTALHMGTLLPAIFDLLYSGPGSCFYCRWQKVAWR